MYGVLQSLVGKSLNMESFLILDCQIKTWSSKLLEGTDSLNPRHARLQFTSSCWNAGKKILILVPTLRQSTQQSRTFYLTWKDNKTTTTYKICEHNKDRNFTTTRKELIKHWIPTMDTTHNRIVNSTDGMKFPKKKGKSCVTLFFRSVAHQKFSSASNRLLI